jgi:hypothetical protein
MNLPMILSASSLITLEDVRRENPDAWYQAYLAGEPSRIEPLVDRVAAAGYDTFVVTADVPVPPNRENNIRNGFQVPLAITPQLAWDIASHGTSLTHVPSVPVPSRLLPFRQVSDGARKRRARDQRLFGQSSGGRSGGKGGSNPSGIVPPARVHAHELRDVRDQCRGYRPGWRRSLGAHLSERF